MPRSLLFYTHALVDGGGERVLARLASGFAARGDRVDFVVDFEATQSLAALSPDVRLRVLPPGHANATRKLARILRDERPDASLSAISISNLKHAAAAVLAGRHRHAILGYHGFFESEAERGSRLGYLLTPLLSRATYATIAVSAALAGDLRTRFHVPPDRLEMIHNPAAPEPFPKPVDVGDIRRRAPLVVAVGRLVEDKDFATLLKAFAAVRTHDARLMILGEGPSRAALEQLARELKIAGLVAMPGFSADVGAVLGSAKCMAISSPRESFSLVCVEALAHGLPVVSTACGGPSEILDAVELGDIVPVGDAEALGRSIERWLEAPGDPSPRQARASDFKLESALAHYDALIDRMLRKDVARR